MNFQNLYLSKIYYNMYLSLPRVFLLLTLAFLVVCIPVKKTLLMEEWMLEIISGNEKSKPLQGQKYNVSLPTTLHLDLLTHNKIEDPFLKDNYPGLRWVSQSNVRYSTNFSLAAETLKYRNHRLVFEGIDTYAKVYLNGERMLETQNAFRKYSILVNQFLKTGQNILSVEISSTKDKDTQGQKKNSMPFQYAHSRKACYQYSWDWAPYLNTLGIWKNVYLESFEDVQINYIWARNRLISESKAIINFAIALDVPQKIEENYEALVMYENKVLGKHEIKEKNIYIDVQIQKPRLWWPNGIGEPFIYDFEVKLVSSKNETIDSRSIPYGIRSVRLDQTNNQFTVIVNGYPVYAKGANYVPPDMFYPRLTNSKYTPGNTISNLINDAAQSHFNMIRLWGGGQYESEEFFELASRKGIMIFYDFMFSDSVYPSTEKFLLNVEEEIKHQIRRVRNYPCLALWSGNNQILQGINDWGWGQQRYREDYKRLFEILIPKIIQIENPDIHYIPSSPVKGVGNSNFKRGGDFHYWGVWAAGSSFQSYATAVGPFNSQFGTQALPVWETICQMVDQKDRNYDSKVLLTHQRHNSKFNTLKNYMNQYMQKSLNFELQTYQSGLLQAYAIEVAIKHQRSSKPNSQGTLYWQFNDAWPAISWSSIDYFGRWKPLQFMAKRLYPDIAIMYTSQHGLKVINDKLYPVEALVLIQLITFQGEYLINETKTVSLQANQVRKLDIDLGKVNGKEATCVLYTEIVGGRKEVMSSTHFFKKFKELELPNGQLTIEYHPEYKQITLSSDKVLKNLFISHSKHYIKTSDNYFDLIPGHKVKIQVLGSVQMNEQFITGMVYRSYRQVYIQEPLKLHVISS